MDLDRDIKRLRTSVKEYYPNIDIVELNHHRINIKEYDDEKEFTINIDKVYNIKYDDEKGCDQPFILPSLDPIGEESCNAKIYLSCCIADCSYVVKYMNYNEESFNEIILQIKMSKYSVSPKIYQIWVSEDRRKIFFIMDHLQSTLRQSLKTISAQQQSEFNKTKKIITEDTQRVQDIRKNLIDQLLESLDILHIENYYHNDAHLHNFMIDEKNKLYIIDYGKSSKVPFKNNLDYTNVREGLEILIENECKRTNLQYLLDYFNEKLNEKLNKKSKCMCGTPGCNGLDCVPELKCVCGTPGCNGLDCVPEEHFRTKSKKSKSKKSKRSKSKRSKTKRSKTKKSKTKKSKPKRSKTKKSKTKK